MILIDQVSIPPQGATTVSFDHIVKNSNEVLVVLANGSSGATSQLNSITYNGVPLSILNNTNAGGTTFAGIGYMVNPPVGIYTIVVSGLGTLVPIALTLQGVDKASLTPVATGTSGATTFNLPVPTANSLVLWTMKGAFTSTEQTPINTANNANLFAYQFSNAGTAQITKGTGVIAGIVLEPSQAPSISYPNITIRNVSDTIPVYGLNVGVPASGSYGDMGNAYWQNSFLHTVGRLPSAPPPVPVFTPSMSTLQDNFHANQLDTSRWSLFTAGGASFVTNPTGAGTVYPASTTSSTDGDISSINAYDLTGSYAFVRIVQPLSLNAGSSDTTFSVRTTGVNSLQFQIEGGTLFAQHIVAGAQSNLKNIPYSGVQHAWLRIREQAGRVYWETSQDGPNGPTGWSWFWDEPNPINVTSLKVLLAGTSFGVDTNPGQFIFDNLNTLPVGIFDQFNFQPNNPAFYSGEFWYAVGRLLPQSTTTPPTLVAETELQTSQTVVDRLTQQAVASGTSVTSDHLVSSQDAVMLIFASQMGVAQALNAVTLNGVALVPLGNPSVSTLTAGAYYVVNPNVGINVISASATLPTALELVVMTLLGVDKKTTTPVIVANTGALGSPSSTITPASANALLIDYVGSLGTSISENPSQTVYFDQPQAASQAAGSIKLSTAGLQTMSWTTLSSAWVQLVVALEPANALSIWHPSVSLRNLSDVIAVGVLDDVPNPVGNFYGTFGDYSTQYWQNSFLHTVGRILPSPPPVNASTSQVAGTVTVSGGTQVIASTQIANVTQVAATVTVTGGTQTVASVNIAAVSQSAATVTVTGGTQTVATVSNASITQVAGTVTASGGTQTIATVNFATLSQTAGTVTVTGGTQTVAAKQISATTQSSATVTVSGGTQSLATVNIVASSQTAATVTVSGGTQVIAAGLTVNTSQIAGVVTVSGGTQTLAAQIDIALAQLAGQVLVSGGTQSALAITPPVLTPMLVTVSTLSTTENLSDSGNTPILKGEIDNKNLNDSNNQININTTSTER